MAAHASFIAADNVPANHTFTRVNIDGSTVRYEERVGTSSLAWKSWTSSLRAPLAGNGAKVYKSSQKFVMPVTADETINGVTVPKKIREYVADVTLLEPADGTEAERLMFEALLRNGLGSTAIKDNTVYLLPNNGP
jgi:hypothetical protein